MPRAELYVNKLAVARRQLIAAIRMYFRDEDRLAVHTVAGAAFGILKDLRRDRGKNEAIEAFRAAIFYAARDYKRGISLPDELRSDDAFMQLIEEVSQQIAENIDYIDFELASIPRATEERWWKMMSEHTNFLKHASRDTAALINIDELNTETVIMTAGSSYIQISGECLVEMLAFTAYCSNESDFPEKQGSVYELVHALSHLSDTERKAALRELVEKGGCDEIGSP